MGMQAAQAGANARLYLCDEVDAALDEPNQALLAFLFRRLTGSDTCQIIAISHNSAFQMYADTIIKVLPTLSCGNLHPNPRFGVLIMTQRLLSKGRWLQ